jgi:hypothetical protein
MICSDFLPSRRWRDRLIISFQSFKERLQLMRYSASLVLLVLNSALYYFTRYNLYLERFPLLLFGGAKIKTLFLTTKFFSIFFRTFFHSSFRISVNGSAKVVQQFILTNKFHENITRNVLCSDYQYIKF